MVDFPKQDLDGYVRTLYEISGKAMKDNLHSGNGIAVLDYYVWDTLTERTINAAEMAVGEQSLSFDVAQDVIEKLEFSFQDMVDEDVKNASDVNNPETVIEYAKRILVAAVRDYVESDMGEMRDSASMLWTELGSEMGVENDCDAQFVISPTRPFKAADNETVGYDSWFVTPKDIYDRCQKAELEFYSPTI